MSNSAGEIILLVLIHALVLALFFGSDDPPTPREPAAATVSGSSEWNHVANYAARLEQKAANAELYFK